MKRIVGIVLLLVPVATLALAARHPPSVRAVNCQRRSVGLIPLTELVGQLYLGYPGGLYPNAKNDPPASHLQLALTGTGAVKPLDRNGNASGSGKIVLLSLGTSNTTREFQAFQKLAGTDPQVNPRLAMVDGAQDGKDAKTIHDPADGYWTIVDDRLAGAGVTGMQVQAIWLKEYEASPSGAFPGSAEALRDDLKAIVLIAHDRFPNLRLLYLSSRTYGGYSDPRGAVNPEPFAYESGFAVRGLLDMQIAGDPALNADPAKGVVRASPLLWGPYLWADGQTPRRDGLYWSCSDYAQEGTLISVTGAEKVANLLLGFFKTDSTARPWFMASPQATPIPSPTYPPTPTQAPPPTVGPRIGPLRSYRISEVPSGDRMWVTTNYLAVQLALESITPARPAWVCGTVTVDQAAEWGFRFVQESLQVMGSPGPIPGNQTTIRTIAANPSAVAGQTRCIQTGGVVETVDGTPPAVGTPGTPFVTRTPGPGPQVTPVPGSPTATSPIGWASPTATPPWGHITATPTPPGSLITATATSPIGVYTSTATSGTPRVTPTKTPAQSPPVTLFLPLAVRNT